jgi:hypothetical protein
MIPIAHRGDWWPDPVSQNQLKAIVAAAKAGYGLELDVRVRQGQLLLQHDLTATPWLLTGDNAHWDLMLDALRLAPVILWDIKEPESVEPLGLWLAEHNLLATAMFFDLELAAPNWAWRGLLPEIIPGAAYLRRASETESLYTALDDKAADGIWLDAWDTEWVSRTAIEMVQSVGKKAYVCSSELHRRPVRPKLWHDWLSADGICTDFPHLLASLLVDRQPDLHPAGWHAETHRS